MIDLDFGVVLEHWPLLAKGAGMTVVLTAFSACVGVSLGIACARGRTHGAKAVRIAIGAYVELIRNTPFIVQLFFVFFGLPQLHVKLSAELASVLAMVINLGAYSAEIVRAGIVTTPRGQIEAGRSLALSESQVFLRVVLPPALKRVWPSLVSQIVIVMLGSAVCSQVSTQELFYATNYIVSLNFRQFEGYFIAGTVYLLLSVALRRVLSWIGPRFIFGR